MKIRKAQKSDVSSLYALEGELFLKENYPLSRGSFAYHVQNNLLYVAEVEGKIAGYVLVLVKRKNAKLYSIGVAKAYRNRKISHKLLKAVYKELESMGFETLLLEVRVDNEIAIALYEKEGFKVQKKLKYFYRDGCDAYLMEKR